MSSTTATPRCPECDRLIANGTDHFPECYFAGLSYGEITEYEL